MPTIRSSRAAIRSRSRNKEHCRDDLHNRARDKTALVNNVRAIIELLLTSLSCVPCVLHVLRFTSTVCMVFLLLLKHIMCTARHVRPDRRRLVSGRLNRHCIRDVFGRVQRAAGDGTRLKRLCRRRGGPCAACRANRLNRVRTWSTSRGP